jgi:organic hydroperoxide reductase OsmC/OhrA
MSEHTARIRWTRREGEPYTDGRYSRGHEWQFDGGAVVPASSSPHVVPVPLSIESAVDPEEAFVASLSSCHMLFFLSIAAAAGWVVDEYTDECTGIMTRDAAGEMAMSRVTLRPSVRFAGERAPTYEELRSMHHRSHEQCFLARSVRCAVVTEIEPHSRSGA